MRAPSLEPTSIALASFLAFISVPACGGAGHALPEPAAAPSSSEAPAPSSSALSGPQEPAPAPRHLPTACADSSATCTPPGDFVERLCVTPMQDVALALFAKETPFTRLYLKGRLDELDFDEEVLALRFTAPRRAGWSSVAGTVLSTCFAGMGRVRAASRPRCSVRSRPARPRSAHVQWHRVGSAFQDALIAGSEAVKRAHAKRGKECQGAMSGDVSKACESPIKPWSMRSSTSCAPTVLFPSPRLSPETVPDLSSQAATRAGMSRHDWAVIPRAPRGHFGTHNVRLQTLGFTE